jgi:hypothetical protein
VQSQPLGYFSNKPEKIKAQPALFLQRQLSTIVLNNQVIKGLIY